MNVVMMLGLSPNRYDGSMSIVPSPHVNIPIMIVDHCDNNIMTTEPSNQLTLYPNPYGANAIPMTVYDALKCFER